MRPRPQEATLRSVWVWPVGPAVNQSHEGRGLGEGEEPATAGAAGRAPAQAREPALLQVRPEVPPWPSLSWAGMSSYGTRS